MDWCSSVGTASPRSTHTCRWISIHCLALKIYMYWLTWVVATHSASLAYLHVQLELEEKSKILATISSHGGLYYFNRLPFGIASTQAIWQRPMGNIASTGRDSYDSVPSGRYNSGRLLRGSRPSVAGPGMERLIERNAHSFKKRSSTVDSASIKRVYTGS